MENKLVSVIVPVYNSERYIEKCITSIIEQSYTNLEIICINDGSTDSSPDILLDLKEKDNRLKIISQENKGQSEARNRGIQESNGEYILFVDSDDWIEENAVELLYSKIYNTNADVVLFNSVTHMLNSTKNRIYNLPTTQEFIAKTFNYTYNKDLIFRTFFVIWSKFYKSSFLKEHKIDFKHPLFEDIFFHVKVMLYAKNIAYLPEILYNYRKQNQKSLQHDISITSKSYVLLDIIQDIGNLLIEMDKMDELYYNFIFFNINELKNNFELINPSSKKEYFNRIKNHFKQMSLDSNILSQLPLNIRNFYLNVLYNDFNSTITNNIFLNYIYSFEQKNRELSNHLINIDTKYAENSSEFSSLKFEVKKLSEQFTQQNKAIENIIEEKIVPNNNITPIQTELEKNNREITDKEKTIEYYMLENSRLNKNIEDLNLKEKENNETISNLKQENTILNNDISDMNAKLKETRCTIEDKNKTIEDIQQKNNDLIEKCENLENQIDILNSIINQMKMDHEKIINKYER